MKHIQYYSYLACLILGLQLVVAQSNFIEEQTSTYWCDESVLNRIVNKLNEINKKVETIDIVNKKLDLLDSKLMWLNLNSNTKTLEHLAEATLIQAKLEVLNQTMKDIHQSQLEQRMNVEKHFVDINRTLHEEITNLVNAQKVQIDQLTTTTNEQHSMKKKIETQIEQGFNDIKEKYENITTETKIDEFQNLRNTIEDLNQTLNSLVNHFDSPFSSCTAALQLMGRSGVYSLYMPHTNLTPFDAYCLEDSDEGSGWTIIQRRQDGSVSFNRYWQEYKHGFGDPSGEYWLGLEKIHAMTSKGKYELWIELGDHEGELRHAKYAVFEIGNEEDKYYMKTLGEYTGNAGDSLYGGKKFSTYDQDNDDNDDHCASIYQSSWWYSDCDESSLNGEYNNNETGQGINWYAWHEWEYSLKYAHMAIRPVKSNKF